MNTCENCKYYQNKYCHVREAKPNIPLHTPTGTKLIKKPTDGCIYWQKKDNKS